MSHFHRAQACPRRLAKAGLWVLASWWLAAPAPAGADPAPLHALGVENEYADLIAQVGGSGVSVGSIVNDPNTDPHSFEASPSVARAFADADLVVVNGGGYDAWAQRLLAASARPARRSIDVQKLVGAADDAPNPHFWYDPRTAPALAEAVEQQLALLRPGEAEAFGARRRAFVARLKPWSDAIAAFRTHYAGARVATTEPVADYLLQAMGAEIATPPALEKAIMDGTDPAPQDISAEMELLTAHKVKAFVYNRQVSEPLTQSLLDAAKKAGVPVVAVYETMPPGFDYPQWMQAETQALTRAVAEGVSTETLTDAR